MQKLHLVFDADAVELVDVLKNFVTLIGWDYSLDVAATWAKSKKGDDPDVILVNGTCDFSSVDMNTGKYNRDNAMLKRLKEIRLSRPNSRIVILLPPEKEENKELLVGLVSLGIYDIYFIDEFNKKDIENWVKNKKTLSDVEKLLPDANIPEPKEITESTNVQFKNPEEPDVDKEDSGFLGKWFKSHKLTAEAETEKHVIEKRQPSLNISASNISASEIKNNKPVRKRTGKPFIALGLGSQQLDDWFSNTFSDLADINAKSSTAEELAQAIEKYKPDIVVLMRSGPMGGIPDADILAESACKQVPAVLFIAGELDEQGREMEARVKSAGGYVLSCPQGETISGDELVFLMQSIMRDLSKADEADDVENIIDDEDKTHKIQLESLKSSVVSLSKLLKDNKKKFSLKEKIKDSDGISFEEDSPIEQINTNVKNPTAIVPGGLVAVVTPWRPALAGRLVAAIANMLAEENEEEKEIAIIGASGQSTVSVWLDIPEDELIMSDWRVPGSQAPIIKDNFKIWAVDPAKALHINLGEEILTKIKECRKTATYTLVDYAGDFELAQKAAFQGRAVVLVIVPGGDPVEQKTSLLWLNQFIDGKQNIVTGIDLRGVPPQQPKEFKPKVTIRNNPADAIKMALRKNLDEYVWN